MKILTIPQWKKKLWRIFSTYIRKRDSDDGYGQCISCGKYCAYDAQWHAGHYYTKGSSFASMVFDERNVNGQCCHCNTYLEGNKQGYTLGLIKKYGKNILEDLEIKKSLSSKNIWTRWEYEVLFKHYKELVKKM